MEERKSVARYLQNTIIREDGTAFSFAAQKLDPEAEWTDPRTGETRKGSFRNISSGKPDYNQTPYALDHIAANAIQAGLKPMTFYKLGPGSKSGERKLAKYLNVVEGEGEYQPPTEAHEADEAAATPLS